MSDSVTVSLSHQSPRTQGQFSFGFLPVLSDNTMFSQKAASADSAIKKGRIKRCEKKTRGERVSLGDSGAPTKIK